MRPLELETQLRDALREMGVDVLEREGHYGGAGWDARAAWEAFKQVAAIPVYDPFEANGMTLRVLDDEESDSDGLLFESGMWPGGQVSSSEPFRPPAFELTFSRQLTFHQVNVEVGEYSGMNSLTLAVEVAPSPALEKLKEEQLWGAGPFAGEALADPEFPHFAGGVQQWAAAVERTPAFQGAFEQAPDRFSFGQDDI